jgi:hypothetical protein
VSATCLLPMSFLGLEEPYEATNSDVAPISERMQAAYALFWWDGIWKSAAFLLDAAPTPRADQHPLPLARAQVGRN